MTPLATTPMLLLLSFGASPEQLAAAVPEARETLEACASTGCPRADGARAAYVMAVHTYVDEGVADPALAGTVRALDPDLFDTLPDVVRDAAGAPQEWATWVGGTEESHQSKAVGPASFPASFVPVDDPPEFQVVLVDHEGQPIPTGILRFDDEGENHLVHTETGAWTGTTRYLPDGTEAYFLSGDRIQLLAFAPGYTVMRATMLVPKRKKRRQMRIVLQPFQPAEPELEVGKRAVEAWTDWVASYDAYTASPTEATMRETQRQRETTYTLVREWMDTASTDGDPPDDAVTMCMQTTTTDTCI